MKKALSLPLTLSLVCASAHPMGTSRRPDTDEKKIEEKDERPRARAAVSVSVEQVRVDVTVQDRDKNLIRGLQKEHFKIYEDKVLQEIINFTPIEAPMTVVLVVEYSRNMFWEFLYEALMASYTFVKQMRKGDWVAVVAYDLRPAILVDFTQNKYEVYNALRRLNRPAFRESNLYDTIFDTLDRVEENEGKTAVVLVSTGFDTLSKHTLGKTLDRVRESRVVIYPVGLGGNFRARNPGGPRRGMMSVDFAQAEATLKAFARYTGGTSFFPRFTQQFPGIFQTISLLLKHQYSLSYISTNTKKDGKYRKLKVKVEIDIDGDGKIDKLKAHHREGYRTEKKETAETLKSRKQVASYVRDEATPTFLHSTK